MRTQSIDTSPEVERVQIARIRALPITKRFASLRGWTQLITNANIQALREQHKNANESEIARIFVAQEYGGALAADLRSVLTKKSNRCIQPPDIFAATISLIETFERLGIFYYISGSIAGSIYGFPRGAQDIDLVADLHVGHLLSLEESLQCEFILDLHTIYEAIQHQKACSMLHMPTLLKIDIFIPTTRHFDQSVRHRVQHHILVEGYPSLRIASPEEMILRQLERYRMGGEVADDQWNDLLGIIKVQAPVLDLNYLQKEAIPLDVADLLEQAFMDAGLQLP